MRPILSLATPGLVVLAGMALPALAQHGPHGGRSGGNEQGQPTATSGANGPHDRGAQQRTPTPRTGPRQQAPAPHAGARPGQPRAERQPQRRNPDRPNPQAREWQREKGWQKGDGWKGAHDWKGSRAQHWENDHRDWKQRGGYGGHRIPPDRFDRRFGPHHFFRLHRRPMLYGGYPRFYYGGYSFLIVDPWPEFWVDDWYAADETYIVWDDGYYLYNRRHPGFGVAISVMF
jgi:hypothetical protein